MRRRPLRLSRAQQVLGAAVLAVVLTGTATTAAVLVVSEGPRASVADSPRPSPTVEPTPVAPSHQPVSPRVHTITVKPPPPPPVPEAAFQVASFNVLGSSHTAGRQTGAAGRIRVGWASQLLRGAGVDVVGLQELEPDQFQVMRRTWTVWPGMALGKPGVRNSIAWDPAVFTLVEGHQVQIPYFHGNLVPMPYVLLEHRETGRRAWFLNTHSPRSGAGRGDNERFRDRGTATLVALMRRLDSPRTPVVLTGDFNERAEAFCTVTGDGIVAANGGTSSPCRPPAGHGIDWIFGTSGVDFSGYRRIDNRASDHPLITATATLAEPLRRRRPRS